MIKISRVEAYQYMDQADFDLMDKIHAELAAVETNNYRELSSQFFVQGDRTLYLEFYLDGVRVEHIVFLQTKIKLTADGERRLAEAVEGANVEMENEKISSLAFETNHHAYNLSVEVMDLKVIYEAVMDLDGRIDEIVHKGWDDDITMARLSIGEIKDSVRLVSMAFHPLLTSIRENVKGLENHSSELFKIIRDQTVENKKA